MVRLFFRLVYEMLKNYPHLNDDLENNFYICKRICKKVLRSAKIQVDIRGKQYVPDTEHFLIASNHRCFFDVVFLISALERPVCFAAAKELLSYPILNKYLEALHCVMIDRKINDFEKVKENICQIRDTLKKDNLVLFPEGQCSYYDKRIRKFKRGGFIGAILDDVRILPVYIHIEQMANIGKWMIPKKKITVSFAQSFHPSEVSEKEKKAGEVAAYTKKKVLRLQSVFSENNSGNNSDNMLKS